MISYDTELQSNVYNFLFEKILLLGVSEKLAHGINSIVLLLALGLVLYVVDYFLRKIFQVIVIRFTRKSKTKFDDYLIRNKVLKNLTHFIPLVIAKQTLPLYLLAFQIGRA